MHKNRTAKGLALERKHQESYSRRLMGKKHKSGGTVIEVEWCGNSVYGFVKCRLDTGSEVNICSHFSFRPNKEDIQLCGIIL